MYNLQPEGEQKTYSPLLIHKQTSIVACSDTHSFNINEHTAGLDASFRCFLEKTNPHIAWLQRNERDPEWFTAYYCSTRQSSTPMCTQLDIKTGRLKTFSTTVEESSYSATSSSYHYFPVQVAKCTSGFYWTTNGGYITLFSPEYVPGAYAGKLTFFSRLCGIAQWFGKRQYFIQTNLHFFYYNCQL